jgi:hypothetical protein
VAFECLTYVQNRIMLAVDVPRYFPLEKSAINKKSVFSDGTNYPLTRAERDAINLQAAQSL